MHINIMIDVLPSTPTTSGRGLLDESRAHAFLPDALELGEALTLEVHHGEASEARDEATRRVARRGKKSL